MAIVDLPDNLFRRAQWSLVQPAQVNRSEWTNRRQVMQLPGAAYWTVSLEHVPIIGEAAMRPWKAFQAKMRGQVNKVRIVAVESAQHAGDNPVVTSGAAGGFAIGLSGMPVSATFLPAGSNITIAYAGGEEQLLVLAADLVADASGVGSAIVEPMLRRAAAGATVETRLPWCLVAFDDPSATFAVDPGRLYAVQLSTATEAF